MCVSFMQQINVFNLDRGGNITIVYMDKMKIKPTNNLNSIETLLELNSPI